MSGVLLLAFWLWVAWELIGWLLRFVSRPLSAARRRCHPTARPTRGSMAERP
jgi:hypothetical protein